MASKAVQNDFVGNVALDLAKITEMAAEEVGRIGSSLTGIADEIRTCQTGQERRACVAKAMREYETAVQWIQVIVPPEETEASAFNDITSSATSTTRPATSVAAHPAKTTIADGGKSAPGATPATAAPTKPAPTWCASARVPSKGPVTMKAVPPPPSHPPSLPALSRQQQGFRGDNQGSWSQSPSHCSSTASLHTPQEVPQQPAGCNPNFNMDGTGSWSTRSSSTCPEAPYFNQNQGAGTMPLNFQQQPQQPQQPSPPQMQNSHAHPQQHVMFELQQRLAHMMLPGQGPQTNPQQQANNFQAMQQAMTAMTSTQPMAGMQNAQAGGPGMQNMQNTQPMCGMQNAQAMGGMQNAQSMGGMQNTQAMVAMQGAQPMQGAPLPPGNFQTQVIVLPIGAPPPQGTILAATAVDTKEVFQQDLCQVANAGKFRIINPSTGEQVQGPTESDKNSKRLRIVNPGTGKEVLLDDVPSEDKENAESGSTPANSNGILEDVNAKSVGASWDWPLSRHEIRDRLVQLPY